MTISIKNTKKQLPKHQENSCNKNEEDFILLYRAVSRLFIEKMTKEKMKNTNKKK